MQRKYVNINGKLSETGSASVPYDSRAFRYGYGLFETILFRNGQIELKEYHTQRLFEGAKQLGFEVAVHMNEKWFAEEITRTVEKNKMGHLCRVRLQLFASPGGIFEHDNREPGYTIECFPLDEDAIHLNQNGLVLHIAKNLRKSIDSLSNIKSCSALLYVMAALQAKANRWNDALVINERDNVIESTIANLFIIRDKIIYTPPLSEGCIAGVMRSWLLEVLPEAGFTIREAPLTTDMLKQADEVFLTNAIRRIKWVSAIGEIPYNRTIITEICNHIF